MKKVSPEIQQLITKYQYKLEEIPVEHRDLFSAINENIALAFKKYAAGNKSLTRTSGNGYYLVHNDELIEISKYTDDAPEGLYGWWIASESSIFSKWYSDPMPTLKSLLESLGV